MHTIFWSEYLRGKRPLRKPRHRWEDKIRMDVRGIGWEGVDWIDLAHYRDNLRVVVSGSIKGGEFLD
jgi:hypothetical protein